MPNNHSEYGLRWWWKNYERKRKVKQAIARGEYDIADLYRMCAAPHEWRELGYEQIDGEWRLRKPSKLLDSVTKEFKKAS